MNAAFAEQAAHSDAEARRQALDIERSFIVKAPAGSGKTELLTRRFLALLAVVEQPEHILAITFTRAATAEMRDRVLSSLQRAAALRHAGEPAQDTLAQAALEHAEERGWSLLEQPHRLNLQTIDALSLTIAHDAPLLSRLGGRLQPTEDAKPLYSLAARRTVEHLGDTSSSFTAALEQLLRLRDVNHVECETLIADMLCNRDQWLACFPMAALDTPAAWNEVRERLEAPMRREQARVAATLRSMLDGPQGEQLLVLADYACGNEPKSAIAGLKGIRRIEEMIDRQHFECLRSFLLTQTGTWFKQVNKNHGFPVPAEGGSARHKTAFMALIRELSSIEGLLETLNEVDCLPAECYSDEEWSTIRAIVNVLLHAAAELRVVFAEQSSIDFVEAGITAACALEDPEVRRRWSSQVHHLLVDEFQDTSRRQFNLLRSLVQDWAPDEHRTCFLVGDPMQSIYLFRYAELALFDEVERRGLDPVTFDKLTLRRNFRSGAGIVDPLNRMFACVEQARLRGFPAHFTPAVADPEDTTREAVHVAPQFVEKGTAEQPGPREREAARILEAIRPHLPAVERARADGGEYRIGILVRSKSHIPAIALALREAGLAYRAIEMETLEERQEVRDLLSLTRALLSPLDRVAWLSILRAPWCGLGLADLHVLSGDDEQELQKQSIPHLLATRIALLSRDGQIRARHVFQTMQLAMHQRFSSQFTASPHGFAAWIERTWETLGGAHCVDADARSNVRTFMTLLGGIAPHGIDAQREQLAQRLTRCFAEPAPGPGAEASDRVGVQLLTIHKAKGLGFTVVLVPAMERTTYRSSKLLLQWMTRARRDSTGNASGDRELLIAPIGSKEDASSANYKWVCRQRQREEQDELRRVLYVACTRARRELHLFASIGIRRDQKTGSTTLGRPLADTLLMTAWPYLESVFEERHLENTSNAARSVQSATGPAGGPFLVSSKRAFPGEAEPGLAFGLAASVQPGAHPVQRLRRLPVRWLSECVNVEADATSSIPTARRAPAQRTAYLAQTAGTVVHTLFQQLASFAEGDPRCIPTAPYWGRVAAALLRAAGLDAQQVQTSSLRVLALLHTAAGDAHGRWILGRRNAARSESAWTTYAEGAIRELRADRAFLAGDAPLSEGTSHLWIVDYKTTESFATVSDTFSSLERTRHEQQLTGYGQVLREALACDLPLRLALYYPSLPYLLWWAAE